MGHLLRSNCCRRRRSSRYAALVNGLAAQQNCETLGLIIALVGAADLKVLVFDIDGTLTLTNRVDGEFFRNAVRAVLPSIDLDSFARFMEMTDSAILRDICSEVGESDYTSIEAAVRGHFVAGLQAALETVPQSFSAVRGAQTVFSAIRNAGWVPAIATGGWRPSAELKLEAAGISTVGVPLATSSERDRRVDIILLAVAEATEGVETSAVAYVGDGTWDVRACRELGIGFIGRGDGEAADRLTRLGARAVVEDFTDVEALLGLLSDPGDLRLSGAEV